MNVMPYIYCPADGWPTVVPRWPHAAVQSDDVAAVGSLSYISPIYPRDQDQGAGTPPMKMIFIMKTRLRDKLKDAAI